jgi:hypothetical protein
MRCGLENRDDLAIKGASFLRKQAQQRAEIRVGRFELAKAPGVPAEARRAILDPLKADAVAVFIVARGCFDPIDPLTPDSAPARLRRESV